MTLPFSPAAENNKQAILEVLATAFADVRHVLEIGSGTGQHAVYFSQHLPHVTWTPSDLAPALTGIRARLAQEGGEAIADPLLLDLSNANWPVQTVDAIFSANVVHIVSWPLVEALFEGLGRVLEAGGMLCLYGPYKYNDQYTTESNANFDLWLKDRDPQSGIKDFEAVNALALAQGLHLVQDHAMPANNQLLVWRRGQ